jgi:hypothetical protein
MPIERDPAYKSQLDPKPVERDPTVPREYHGSIAEADVPAGDSLENTRNAWRGTGAVLQDWRKREAEIDADPYLSLAGKLAKKQKELPAYEEKFSVLETVVAAATKRLEKLETETAGVVQFTDKDSVGAIRSAELRTWFATLSRADQIAKLHDAVRNGDAELPAAIISAPAAMGLIAPELREHLIASAIEKKNPAAIAEIARQRRVIEAAKFGLTRARALMRENLLKQDVRARLVVGNG